MWPLAALGTRSTQTVPHTGARARKMHEREATLRILYCGNKCLALQLSAAPWTKSSSARVTAMKRFCSHFLPSQPQAHTRQPLVPATGSFRAKSSPLKLLPLACWQHALCGQDEAFPQTSLRRLATRDTKLHTAIGSVSSRQIRTEGRATGTHDAFGATHHTQSPGFSGQRAGKEAQRQDILKEAPACSEKPEPSRRGQLPTLEQTVQNRICCQSPQDIISSFQF